MIYKLFQNVPCTTRTILYFLLGREKVFEKENTKGSRLVVQMEYTALPLVCLPKTTEFQAEPKTSDEIAKSIKEKITTDTEDGIPEGKLPRNLYYFQGF